MARKREQTVLTLLRHGQSTYNLEGLYQGDCDAPELTTLGKQQAADARHILATRYDAVWCSPLRRAHHTAAILSHLRPDLPDLEMVRELAEIALPLWQGRAFRDVRLSEPEAHKCWKFTPSRFVMATESCGDRGDQAIGDDSFSPAGDVLGRAEFILDKARRLPVGQTVLAVTHGGMIRALMSRVLGMSADHLHAAVIDNCSMTQIAFDADGAARLVAFNRRAMSPQNRLAEKIAQGARLFAVGPEGSANALRRVTGQRMCRMSVSDTALELQNAAGPVIAEVGPEAQEDLFRQVLGLSSAKALAMPLQGDGLHVFTKPTAANPAALWLFNEVLTDDMGLNRLVENEVELA